MDAFEPLQILHTRTAVETVKRPLVPAIERTNGITPHRSRTREVSCSRYKSPTPSFTSANSRQCQSPNITRIISPASSLSSSLSSTSSSASSHAGSRRAVSPIRSSTPASDTDVADTQLSNKNITNNGRLHEVLWPSTMRSLSVSFQSDSISIPVSRKEKQGSYTHSDRTLKPSCNVARKPTPERKTSPLKGRNSAHHQSENSKPADGWPSRMRDGTLTKSIDLRDNLGKKPSTEVGRSVRRLSTEDVPKPLQKASSDAAKQAAFDEDIVKMGLHVKAMDDSLLRVSTVKASFVAPNSVRSTSSISGSQLPSPSKVFSSKTSPSPCKTRSSMPTQKRGTSPSRVIRQSVNTTTSVLSFIADVKKSRKTNHLEVAHHLRILYNRFLQWRFANARVDAAMFIQKITAEQTLYNVWQANLELWDSVIMKRIELERLKSELKLNLVLRKQIGYLEDWGSFQNDHSASLSGVIKDLKSSTLRLPVIGGAKADVDSLKAVISSAIGVMQAMGSSICTLPPKVKGMSSLVSELSELAGQERSMLNECDALLASTTAMQVREYSLRTQLVQSQQDLSGNTMQTLLWTP